MTLYELYRVFFILGNRDINKMRFTSEISDVGPNNNFKSFFPPGPYWVPENKRVSFRDYLTKTTQTNAGSTNNKPITEDTYEQHNTKTSRLIWMFKETMGADGEFEHRRSELAILSNTSPDKISNDQVVQSFEGNLAISLVSYDCH